MKTQKIIDEIFKTEYSCHPSRLDDIRNEEAIRCLAVEIDNIKADIEYLLRKNPPSWIKKTSPYDLNSHPLKRK